MPREHLILDRTVEDDQGHITRHRACIVSACTYLCACVCAYVHVSVLASVPVSVSGPMSLPVPVPVSEQ